MNTARTVVFGSLAITLFSASPRGALSSPTQYALPDRFVYSIGAVQDDVGQFAEPTSVAVAADGTVYVTDMANHRVQYFSPAGEFLGAWGSRGRGDGQFGRRYGGPGDVAVGPTGNVYVIDADNCRVQRFGADGIFRGAWGSCGTGDGQFAEAYSSTGGIAASPDGTVYVVDAGNSRVQRFSATGRFLGRWSGQSATEGWPFVPHSIAVAPDSTVVVTESRNVQIQRFSAEGQFLDSWSARHDHLLEFGTLRIAVAGDGSVYVTEVDGYHVLHFTATGELLASWGEPGNADGQFGRADRGPSGIATAADRTVYVADPLNHRVQRFGPDGEFRGKFGTDGGTNRQALIGDRLAVGPDGSIYVGGCYTWYCSIKRLNAAGQVLGGWGVRGSDEGQLESMADIAVAPDGSVYVADNRNHRIQRFSAAGDFLNMWGATDAAYPGPGELRNPNCIAVAPDDSTVYVCHAGSHIRRYSASGEQLGEWDIWSEVGVTDTASKIAVAPGGNVYVAAYRRYSSPRREDIQIKYYSPLGSLLGQWSAKVEGGAAYGRLVDIAVDVDGSILVGALGDYRMQSFSATGELLGAWGTRGFDPGQFNLTVEDLAIGPTGALHVLDARPAAPDYPLRRIQVFSRDYPSSWRAEYFGNRWLAGWPTIANQAAELDLDWGTNPPDDALPADGFSARFERVVPLPTGVYRFSARAAGGVRLWVGERLVIDDWSGRESTHDATLLLPTGAHRLRLEYNDPGGEAAVRLSWQSEPIPYQVFLPHTNSPD